MKVVIVFCFMSLIEGLQKKTFENVLLCFDPPQCNAEDDSLLGWLGKELEESLFDAREDTIFLLTNRNTKDQEMKLKNMKSLKRIKFDKTKPTKVIIHGFLSSVESRINKIISKTYVKYHDVNVIKGELKFII